MTMPFRFLGDVRRHDPTVARMMDAGHSFGDIIVALANEKRELQQRLADSPALNSNPLPLLLPTSPREVQASPS